MHRLATIHSLQTTTGRQTDAIKPVA